MPDAPVPILDDWSSFQSLQLKMPQWMLEGFLPVDAMICLYGKRGLGKTFLAIDWACCIAAGTDWLGQKVPNRGRVAYVLAERPEGLKRRMVGWLMARRGAETEEAATKIGNKEFDGDQGRFFVHGRVTAIDKEAPRQALIERLKKLLPLRLIVIDPMVSFMAGEENVTRGMQDFVEGVRDIMNQLRKAAEAAALPPSDCSVLLVHHEGKGGDGNFHRGARGSSALEAGMDTVLHLKGVNKLVSELEVTKQREFKTHETIKLRFVGQSIEDLDYGQYPERYIGSAEAGGQTKESAAPAKTKSDSPSRKRKPGRPAKKDRFEADYWEIARLVWAAGSMERDNIHEGLPAGVKRSRSSTYRRLKEMVKANILVERSGESHSFALGRAGESRFDLTEGERKPS